VRYSFPTAWVIVTEVRWIFPEGDLSANGKPPPDFWVKFLFSHD